MHIYNCSWLMLFSAWEQAIGGWSICIINHFSGGDDLEEVAQFILDQGPLR